MSHPLGFLFSKNFGIFKGGSEVYADRGTFVDGNRWKVAAGINVLKSHSLGLAVFKELDATARQNMHILKSLVNLVLVFIVQMRLKLHQWLWENEMINEIAN